jgi:bacillolysin
VTTHEFTHGVTEFTSDLVYQGESGALNESFSDMMGNSSEYWATDKPDWQIGEEIYVGATTVPGFRNMADPAEDGDPDHYSERYTGTADSGGVHTNSGIPNHAYFLVVNGGSNAGEARGHKHSGPIVTGIGLAAAEQIFYTGFTSLPSTATMSQAREATIKAASARYGAGSQQAKSTADAWTAVGVR